MKSADVNRVLEYLIWSVTEDNYSDLKAATEARQKVLEMTHEHRVAYLKATEGVFA